MKNIERRQLEKLLDQLFSDSISDDQVAQLNELLLASAAARQFYTDYLEVQLAMVECGRKGLPHGGDRHLIAGFADIGNETDLSTADLGREKLSKKPSDFPISALYLLLAGLAASALIFLADSWFYVPTESPTTPSSEVVYVEPEPKSDPLYLAQVVRISEDVVWGKKVDSPEFLLRMRRGDRIEIEQGLVQIEYYSGAALILNGPCSYVITGNAAGRLESGRVTGKVTEGDFLLTTPTARVVDLGTEFGVSVDEASDTSVCVFDGKVEVSSDLLVRDASVSVALTEGMAARVDREGEIDRTAKVDARQFARSLPDEIVQNESEISLVDLFSSKSVSQYRLAGVIAPDTGESDRNPWMRDDGPGHRIYNGYQKTDWHPFVDGVFIPSPAGEYSQLDSAGHFVDLPSSTGRTWGPVWSRRKFNQPETTAAYEDYWGTQTLEGIVDRLQRCKTGMIGVHANVGVTFDLNSIRGLGVQPVKFRTIVENLDNSLIKNPEWSRQNRFDADLRVFVDGELRSSRLNFARSDGEQMLEVELHAGDHFLTLVSTNGSANTKNSVDGFDHVVLIDPVFELSK